MTKCLQVSPTQLASRERRTMSITRRRSGQALRGAVSLAMVCLVGTALTACDTPRIADEVHPRLSDPARRHPIVMVAETATLDLDSGGLDKGSEARAFVETTRFVRNYRYEGRGPLNIEVPRGGGGAVSRRINNVRLVAYRNGVSPERMRVVRKAGRHGVVTLSYDRIAAIGPTCGDWSEDVSRNKENLPYPNFGCASQRNLAAMTANPTDLMYPASESIRGSDGRAAAHKSFNTNIGKDPPTLSRQGVR